MAFIASAISKEAVLGVVGALYASTGDVFSATLGTAGSGVNLAEILPTVISKAEALAFIYACTFNMPCLVALASTHRESHSLKWTVKIALYYTEMPLVLSCIVWMVGSKKAGFFGASSAPEKSGLLKEYFIIKGALLKFPQNQKGHCSIFL